MTREFWRELSAAYDECAADRSVRCVIFQSGLKKPVFTAGLDINELYSPGTSWERFQEYWSLLTTVLTKIYSSSMLTIAAINGHCPAGGCILALCCDMRIITKGGKLGLNEVAIGLVPPPYWLKLFRNTCGQRQAERLLGKGLLVDSSELLQLSMVDEEVATPEELLPAAVKEAKTWLSAPDLGRSETKQMLREELANEWLTRWKQEAQYLWHVQSQPESIEALGKVLAS
eukprot:CAMPEP_0169268106 /NCGR_PEP_ID=MMETSP1016-20121227/47587_1 /TAXON_ID=342587 /ORGANISM="Karlodinium micrum, Strain CCMP2283" /LENGTH=229 /DNA_ID=CAMNT_0009352723 /DNA_START=23 /DNA_END=709 /DNA_ORIENTATION=-